MRLKNKSLRFIWRVSRNLLCLVPMTRRMLFPQDRLATAFGRGDAEYAWRVFHHHFNMLQSTGGSSASRILEIGPGRNLGTSLLWWVYFNAKNGPDVEIVCWDVFRNASPGENSYWANLAGELLDSTPEELQETESDLILGGLREIVEGRRQPQISYRVEPLNVFEDVMKANNTKFNLVYSQAAIEHIWDIDAFWGTIVRLTEESGRHSHRIDLADHGSRESNYIEMLEWSRLGYWLTMRFIPGAINRWRAVHHLNKLESLGMKIIDVRREMRERLPIPLSKVASEFRNLSNDELRTTAVDLVGAKLRL